MEKYKQFARWWGIGCLVLWLIESWHLWYGITKELVWNFVLIYLHLHLQNFGRHSTRGLEWNGDGVLGPGPATHPLSMPSYLPERGNGKALPLTKQAMTLVIRKVWIYLMGYT